MKEMKTENILTVLKTKFYDWIVELIKKERKNDYFSVNWRLQTTTTTTTKFTLHTQIIKKWKKKINENGEIWKKKWKKNEVKSKKKKDAKKEMKERRKEERRRKKKSSQVMLMIAGSTAGVPKPSSSVVWSKVVPWWYWHKV